MLGQLRMGALDFFMLSGTPLSSVVPATALTTLPLVFKDRKMAYDAVDGSLGAYLRNEIEAKGLHAFDRTWEVGFFQLTNNVRPIRTADDLSGLKFRAAAGRVAVDTFKALGVLPAALDAREAYTAMKTRLVDGQTQPLVLIEVNKYYEIQRYLTEVNLSWSTYFLMANRASWNALPPDIQAVVSRNEIKYALLQRRDMDLLNQVLADKLTRQGMIRNVADQATFRTKLAESGFYQRWKGEFAAQAWGLLEQARGERLG
jgi:TRAP-type C4-dicarboxylate transport system substrate-binding protein